MWWVWVRLTIHILQTWSIQGFAESLQHCIRPQSSVTALYGSFSALNLPYKEVTEFWGLIQCCKDSENPCTTKVTGHWPFSSMKCWFLALIYCSCKPLASFPGRGRNCLATSASSNCYFRCLKVGSTNQISEHSHMTTVKPNCVMHWTVAVTSIPVQ